MFWGHDPEDDENHEKANDMEDTCKLSEKCSDDDLDPYPRQDLYVAAPLTPRY
jgi:hypothetical protein